MSRALQLKLILLLVLLGWTIVELIPTFQYWPLSRQEREELQLTDKAKFDHLQVEAIKRGLDLQGGVFLVLEVDPGLTLDGATLADAVEGARRVIEERVNQYGVSEANVQKVGERRVVVELPGLEDISAAMRLVGRTALLRFTLLRPASEREEVVRRIDAALPRLLGAAGIDTSAAVAAATVADTTKKTVATQEAPAAQFEPSAPRAPDTAVAKQEAKTGESPLAGLTSISALFETGPGGDLYATDANRPKLEAVLNLVKRFAPDLIPSAGEVLFGKRENLGGRGVFPLFYVNTKSEMTGASVQDAIVAQGSSLDMEQAGKPVIHFTVRSDSVRLFSSITRRNLNERMAIILDNVVYSAPVIRAHINDGRSEITGMADREEARSLAIAIRSGALPAEVQVQEQRYVGPSLGADSIRSSVIASWIGGTAVILFLLLYYRIGGIVAIIGQGVNMLLLMACLAGLHGTLTLPGVAGLLLTLGMAVDSNVLIFERIREEQATGKAPRATIESGYRNASSAIWDSNITTFISAVVLYQFGTGPIRGFALVLGIGIFTTVFSALFITRFIYDLWLNLGSLQRIAIGTSVIKDPHFRFLKWRNPWFIGSGSLVLLSIVSMIVIGFNWGVDFAGGTRLEVRFDPPVDIADVRRSLTAVDIRGNRVDLTSSEIKTVDRASDMLLTVKQFPSIEAAAVDSALRAHLAAAFPASTKGSWVLNAESVGPKIGSELKGSAIWAITFSLVGILVYLSLRFELTFAIMCTVALLHDVLVTLGVFSFIQHEVSLAVVAAVLTVVGYSLNDTIVVFDRIREGLRLYSKRLSYGEILDKSINETLARTIITGGTTLVVVLALLSLSGGTLQDFALILLLGILTGTYSSIYIASALVYFWHNRREKSAAQAALAARTGKVVATARQRAVRA